MPHPTSILAVQPLTNANLRLIVKHQLDEVSRRLSDRNITIITTTAAEDQVLRESYNVRSKEDRTYYKSQANFASPSFHCSLLTAHGQVSVTGM